MREVLSYSRRGSRFTPSQREAWEAHHEAWVIPDEAVDEPGFRLASWFGREAPLVVEIGSGVGEATGVLAAARPAYDVLALEVWRPGVAASLAEVAAAGAANVRFCSVDAVWAVRAPRRSPDRSPSSGRSSPTRGRRRATTSDAWSTASFAALAASRLAPGGTWRLATDWADYAAPDAGRARRRARADRRRDRALGGATGHEVRAQGCRGRPHHRRPDLHPGMTVG